LDDSGAVGQLPVYSGGVAVVTVPGPFAPTSVAEFVTALARYVVARL